MPDNINKIPVHKIRSKYEIFSCFLGFIISGIICLLLAGIDMILLLIVIVYALFSVIVARGQVFGGDLKVNDRNFPELKKIIEKQAKEAGIPEPDLFIRQTPILNAFTFGFDHPYTIVIHSSLIEFFNPAEIETIIAHELGHIYFGHPRIYSVLSSIQNMPLGGFFLPIQLAFNYWSRKAEKTSDQFAVSMTENPRSFVTSFIKMSAGPKLINQIDEVALLNQSLEIQKNKKHRIGEWFTDHPYTINRIAYIINFSDENGMYYRRDESVFCVNCGKMIKLPAKYCDDCGWVIEA